MLHITWFAKQQLQILKCMCQKQQATEMFIPAELSVSAFKLQGKENQETRTFYEQWSKSKIGLNITASTVLFFLYRFKMMTEICLRKSSLGILVLWSGEMYIK